MLEVTKRLGGTNYVLWGGREGYDTLLNTDLKREQATSSPGSSTSSSSTSTRSASRARSSSSPSRWSRPSTSTTTTRRRSTASSSGNGLEGEYQLNIEANHATLAGHTIPPRGRLRRRERAARLHRRQPRRPAERLGHRPVPELGRGPGAAAVRDPQARRPGDRRLQLRRQGPPPEHRPIDLFHAHIGGMDTLARALLVAADLLERRTLLDPVEARYAGWSGALGTRDPRRHARRSRRSRRRSRPARSTRRRVSGRQEELENLVNHRIWSRRLTRWPSSSASTPRRPRPRPSSSTRPGRVAGIGAAEYGFDQPHPLWSEQDPRCGGTARWPRSGGCSPRRASTRADVVAVGLTGPDARPRAARRRGRGPPAGDPVERPADRGRVRRDPRGGRPGAAHRDHRQRRADRVHGAQARLGPGPRAGRLGAASPTCCCPRTTSACALTGDYAMDKADGAGTHPVRPRGPRLVAGDARGARARSRVAAADVRGPGGHGRRERGGGGGDRPARRARRSWPAAATRRRTPSAPAWSSPGTMALSLGTSGVVFAATRRAAVEPAGPGPRVLPRGARAAGT